MILLEHLRSVIDDLRHTSAHQRILRVVVLIAPFVTYASAAIAADELLWAVPLLAGVLAVWCAVQPDTHLGLLLVVVLAWHWVGVVDDVTTPWLLPGALGLLMTHVAMAAAASAPPAARWPAAAIRTWARRTATVAGLTVAAWAAAVVVADREPAGHAAVLVAALLVVATTALAIRARSLHR